MIPGQGTKILHAAKYSQTVIKKKKKSSRKASILTVMFFIILFIYLAVLGLRCCAGFSLIMASGGYPLVAVQRLLLVVASLIVERGL